DENAVEKGYFFLHKDCTIFKKSYSQNELKII
ncbi:MAG: hypothetical protein UX10_C0005G0001, partial [Candidatus Magasanikbacteria bacterium GW2011_GWA2_45_39]